MACSCLHPKYWREICIHRLWKQDEDGEEAEEDPSIEVEWQNLPMPEVIFRTNQTNLNSISISISISMRCDAMSVTNLFKQNCVNK